jgi:hypothetical protein
MAVDRRADRKDINQSKGVRESIICAERVIDPAKPISRATMTLLFEFWFPALVVSIEALRASASGRHGAMTMVPFIA